MKEMIYKTKMGKAELLTNGEYNGYDYIVLSLGTHPCAYIVINENDKLYGLDYDLIHEKFDIYCHGGLTYSEDYLNFLEFSQKYNCDVKSAVHNQWVVGWDYGHDGDYMGFDEDELMGGKKWTTQEIVGECKELIDQLTEINLR